MKVRVTIGTTYCGCLSESFEIEVESAVDWCKNHPKKVLKIMSKSLKALNKFYNKNGLTTESEINNE